MCNETIEGDGPDKLSMKLKVHLIHIHEMMVIDEVTRFSSEPSGGDTPESRKKIDAATRWSGDSGEDTPESRKKIDEVTRFSGEPPGEDMPESMRLIEIVTRFHYVASSAGQRPCKDPKMEGKSMVNCPMCDAIVYGEDDDSLSEELKEHINCVHTL
jgi:hypothetical protein